MYCSHGCYGWVSDGARSHSQLRHICMQQTLIVVTKSHFSTAAISSQFFLPFPPFLLPRFSTSIDSFPFVLLTNQRNFFFPIFLRRSIPSLPSLSKWSGRLVSFFFSPTTRFAYSKTTGKWVCLQRTTDRFGIDPHTRDPWCMWPCGAADVWVT